MVIHCDPSVGTWSVDAHLGAESRSDVHLSQVYTRSIPAAMLIAF